MRAIMFGLAIVLIAALGVGLYIFRIMVDLGSFREIEAHFDGTCERMDGFAGGTEDLIIDRETGWVFVSAFDRRAEIENPDAQVRGAIEVFQLNAGSAAPLDITPATPTDFRPHGISFYNGPEGKRLFVINHRADGTQAIELFDMTYSASGLPALTYVETITDPLIVSPNDLAAVGPRSFYVGNDFSTPDRDGLAYLAEAYLRLNRTTLVYYDGQRGAIAARGLTYANGVAVSEDGETLYLGETTDGALRIYDRNTATGALTQRPGAEGLLQLGTGVDNIDIDAAGRVWVTAHPQLFKVVDLAADPAVLSPAQVLMLTPEGDTGGTVAEVYMGTGELASGPATTAYHEGRMVIGVIFDPYVVVCDPTHEHVISN